MLLLEINGKVNSSGTLEWTNNSEDRRAPYSPLERREIEAN